MAVGSFFFVNYPLLRFLWVLLSFFTIFYALSAVSDYLAAARFGYLLVISIPLWDQTRATGYSSSRTVGNHPKLKERAIVCTDEEIGA